MPCLHPRSETFVPQSRHGKTAPKTTSTPSASHQRKCAHPFTEDHGQRSRDHAPDVSDTWLSEAASELRPSWREARQLMLETHRLPESGRFVEADSGGVKPERRGKPLASALPSLSQIIAGLC